MFDRRLDAPAWFHDLWIITAFMTIIMYSVQHADLKIPFLNVVQTFLCWPSILEGYLTLFAIWAMRYVQRILGTCGFCSFMTYQFICFLPIFILVTLMYGFGINFSFLNFIPYSLYVFVAWRLPSVVFAKPLTDKFILSLAMFLIFLAKFPFSLFPLTTAICGYCLWARDLFKIQRSLIHSLLFIRTVA